MKVEFCSFKPMHDEIRENLDKAYKRVMDSNYFIQGKECAFFEKEFAEYCNAKCCIGVATGLDAIYLILKALNIGLQDDDTVLINSLQVINADMLDERAKEKAYDKCVIEAEYVAEFIKNNEIHFPENRRGGCDRRGCGLAFEPLQQPYFLQRRP